MPKTSIQRTQTEEGTYNTKLLSALRIIFQTDNCGVCTSARTVYDVAIVGVDSEQRLAFRISLDCGYSSLERNTFIVTTTIGYLGFMRASGGSGTDVQN